MKLFICCPSRSGIGFAGAVHSTAVPIRAQVFFFGHAGRGGGVEDDLAQGEGCGC